MTANDPATSDAATSATDAGPAEREPRHDPSLSWLPLLGSAAIVTVMLTLIIIIANHD